MPTPTEHVSDLFPLMLPAQPEHIKVILGGYQEMVEFVVGKAQSHPIQRERVSVTPGTTIVSVILVQPAAKYPGLHHIVHVLRQL
jgi:hypothetical protein